jgi:eukaryotic-like serine/threonine-protein kinase
MGTDSLLPPNPSASDSRLEEALANYLDSLEQGTPLDRLQLLSQYPDLADELQSFFRNRDAMDALVAGFPDALTTAEVIARGELESPTDQAVRYIGDYELQQELGRGGMGVVYRAKQIGLNRFVALKMVLSGRHASSQELQRMKNEAESVAQLDYPHIVPLYEVGSHDGLMFYSMKLIEGSNLAEAMDSVRSDLKRAARLMATIARAVHHAHQRGILHRDLKPGNILLDEQGEPHLTDFGLAKQLSATDAITQSGAMLGTPNYMAPEQARGSKDVTTAVDVYGLGAILYELLTGQPPFRSESWTEVVRKLHDEDPIPPHQANKSVPRDLSMICLKSLEKSPEQRYGSALELAEDLERWLRHEPIQARPTSPVRRLVKWVRRHPTLTALLVVTLLATAGITWQWREAVQANQRYIRELDQNQWGLAQQYWQAGDVISARQLLLQTPRERQGWEWNYHWNLTYNTPYHRLPLLESHVIDMSLSGDGNRLAIAQNEQVIEVWDLQSSTVLRHLKTAPRCTRIVISPNARWLVALHDDGGLLWDLESGAESRELGFGGKPGDVVWNPDNEQYYVIAMARSAGGQETSTLISGFHVDFEEPRYTVEATTHWHRKLQLSADGQRLFYLGSREIFSSQSGERLGEMDLPAENPENSAFPTGKDQAILLALADDDRLALLEPLYVTSDKFLILQRLGQPSRVTLPIPASDSLRFAFSPDGRTLAIRVLQRNFDWDDIGIHENAPFVGPWANWASKPRPWLSPVLLFDTGTGRLQRTLHGFPSNATVLLFHPDSQQLIVGGGEETGDPETTPGTWGDVIFWNVAKAETSRIIDSQMSDVRHLSLDTDGTLIAAAGGDGRIRMWDLSTGQPHTPSANVPDAFREPRVGLHFAPDRNHLAIGNQREIRIFESKTGELLRSIEFPEDRAAWEMHITAVELGPNEQYLVYLNQRGAHVLDSQTNQTVLEVPNSAERQTDQGVPNRARLSPDGRLLAVTYQFDLHGEVRVYDLVSRKLRWRYVTETKPVGFTLGWGLINCAFSPDGRRLAAVGSNGPVLVFDSLRGKLIRRLEGHGNTVWGVCFSPDGSRLATGSYDHTIKLWDMATGEQTITLRGHEDAVHDLLFTPDGRRLVSSSRNGQIRIWETSNPMTPPTASAPSRQEESEQSNLDGVGQLGACEPVADFV